MPFPVHWNDKESLTANFSATNNKKCRIRVIGAKKCP